MWGLVSGEPGPEALSFLMHPTAVNTIVLSRNRTHVLLMKRRDFRVWSLPGGRIDRGETWDQAAIRETEEETGVRVRVDRHVGDYHRPQYPGGTLDRVCTARVVGGAVAQRGPETADVRWFPVDGLPRKLLPFHRISVLDAFADRLSPVIRTQLYPPHKARLMRLLIAVRNLRNRILGPPR